MTEANYRGHPGYARVPAGILIALITSAATSTLAETALERSWVKMIEGCVQFAETGQRSVFHDWDVAFDGGGVCNSAPVCEDDNMTFIPAPPDRAGAVTVRVGSADWVGKQYQGTGLTESVVGSDPAHFFCRSAEGIAHQTTDIETLSGIWAVEARAEGRIASAETYVSLWAGPYIGCGYDGRRYLIEFSLARPGPAVMRLNYPTRIRSTQPLSCAGASS